jgi:diguanylate cyclase (GGDEF)-like protein
MQYQFPLYRFLESIQYERNSSKYAARKQYVLSLFYRYALTLILVLLFSGIRILLDSYLGPVYLLLNLIAVIIASYVGGFGPGIIATALSMLVVEYFYPQNNALHLAIFFLAGLLISILNSLRVYAEDQEKRQGQVIEHQHYHDSLTNLPNMNYLNEILQESIAEAEVEKAKLAILHLNLDRFKSINETFSHTTGDMALKIVAQRLQQLSRFTDLVVRSGSDEFVILMRGEVDRELVVMEVKRILKSFDEPVVTGQYRLPLSVGIGIAMYPDDGKNPSELLSKANAAVQAAKKRGRRNFQFYNKRFNLSSPQRIELEDDLRNALKNEQLENHYQPIVSFNRGDLQSVEVLLRWEHPTRGLLLPYDFIDLAEDLGVLLEITEWSVKEACRQNVERVNLGYPELVLSINLSTRQFCDREFLERILKALKDSRMKPDLLQLEITETAAMDNITATMEHLLMLKEEGIRVAIDDFGTGYSSLSYLKNLSADTLKIDKSFVKDFVSAKKDGAIVQAVIALGHSLGMKVVAEGVEQADQLLKLKELNCDAVQGYVVSRPFSESNLRKWLKGPLNAGS